MIRSCFRCRFRKWVGVTKFRFQAVTWHTSLITCECSCYVWTLYIWKYTTKKICEYKYKHRHQQLDLTERVSTSMTWKLAYCRWKAYIIQSGSNHQPVNQFGKHFCSTFTFNREHTDDSVSLRYFQSHRLIISFHISFTSSPVPGTLHCARYSTLELARPLLKKSSCAACIMCRALVFHLDPAAPVPASAAVDLSSPLITAPLITSQLLITTSHHNSSQLITTYHIPTHHSSTSHTSLITAPLLITTHHSSTCHRSTSHHFSQVHFSSQLITTYHIPTHHSSTSHTSLLTPHLSHHNFSSQLITSQLITAPLLTPLITSELITAPLLTPDITSPLLTPHFSHLPEVHIKLRYIKAWHVGLSGPFILRQQLIHQTYSCYFLENTCWLRLFKLLTRAENSATALSTLMFQSRRVRSQRSKVAISLEFPSGCV